MKSSVSLSHPFSSLILTSSCLTRFPLSGESRSRGPDPLCPAIVSWIFCPRVFYRIRLKTKTKTNTNKKPPPTKKQKHRLASVPKTYHSLVSNKSHLEGVQLHLPPHNGHSVQISSLFHLGFSNSSTVCVVLTTTRGLRRTHSLIISFNRKEKFTMVTDENSFEFS